MIYYIIILHNCAIVRICIRRKPKFKVRFYASLKKNTSKLILTSKLVRAGV